MAGDAEKPRVSLAVTGSDAPVVASEDGVKMYNGSRWVNLGFPNFPSRGTGYYGGWLAASGSVIALTYQELAEDMVSGNKIKAAMLDLSAY